MLTPEFVILDTLKVGVIYKIVAPEFIDTTVPHYFVVVACNHSDNYILVSTTQLQKKIEHLKRRGLDLDTLVFLEPNSENGLTKNSYFNCNDYYTITKDQLVSKVRDSRLEIAGNISKEEYNKLVDAINLSIVNDIPKKLLIYTG